MTETLSPTARMQAELYAPVTAEAAGTKATMRIFGRIDPDGEPWGVSSADVQAAIDSLNENVTDLEVLVQTRGGDAFEGVAIMNMIRALPINTEAVVVGLAASAGSYIVQGADKVTMMPHSQLMIHRGSVLALGQAPDMRMAADRLESLDKTMANIYTEKAGGTADEWLGAMTPETWYTADEAVAAGLADGVRSLPKTPAGAKASLDLTPFAYAGRENAPAPYIPQATQTPAEPPVSPSTDHKESTMDNLEKVLRERLGISADAELDEAALTAELDQALAERAEPAPTPTASVEPAVPEGMTVVSEALLASLQAGAAAGIEARARQHAEDRSKVISAALVAGKIGASEEADWVKAYDRNPENAVKELDTLGQRYPTTPAAGYAGGDNIESTQPISEAEATALAAMTGASKAGLLR